MKKLIFFSILASFSFFGCERALLDDSTKSTDTNHEESFIYRIDINSEASEVQQFTLTSENQFTDKSISVRKPNQGATGHYTSNGGHTVSFSAIENNAGIHGQININGPIYNMHLDSYCVSVVDNKATVAGTVTQIAPLPDWFPYTLEVGYQFYFAVEDNGEGKNSDPDRSHSYVYIAPPGTIPLCDFLLPDNTFYWPLANWYDTAGENDQIQVH